MSRLLSHRRAVCICALIPALACAIILCGIRSFAAEEGPPDLPRIAPETQETVSPPAVTATPLPVLPENTATLYPSDVQTVITDTGRQIVKIYILAEWQSPEDISRETFERDGWRYALTDITENRVTGTDVKIHTETVKINTDTKDLNAIVALLSPTLDYRSEDGYAGLLTLDLSAVKCEEAGYKTAGYTVTATREYPHLSGPDLSLIPKTVTDNGKTLNLADVSWEAQNTVNVDYEDIPESYRAVAKYTASASKTVVTGYVTTAEYTGETAKAVTGDTVYTAYFEGKEINPAAPKPAGTPSQGTSARGAGSIGVTPLLLAALGLAALLGGLAAYFFLRRNVKIYAIFDGKRALAAKARIGAKNPVIDLTPLEGRSDGGRFDLEIERLAAKSLNGKTVEARYGPVSLKHKIAYEGNVYRIEADFHTGTIKAVY